MKRIAHAFEITQKLDKIVLIAAAQLLNMAKAVKTKKTYFSIYAGSSQEISNVISYYHNTMKGMKSLEYRIWARSFKILQNLKKGQERFVYLTKIQENFRKIRAIRLNKKINIIKSL